MIVRTPADLGAFIKERRKTLGIDQAELAKTVGVSRQWVVAIERGHSGAELGLVLRALNSLGVRLDTKIDNTVRNATASTVDIDAIVNSARTKR